MTEEVEFMMERRLRSLFESAHESGKDQIQIRLQTKPTGARIVSLFCFPFITRKELEKDPSFKGRYMEMLELAFQSPRDAFPMLQDMVAGFAARGHIENTVICQVLVQCDEIFVVKDLASGATIQGHEDEEVRQVWHLVRLEKEIESYPARKGWFPLSNKQGNWKITDIDDLLDGNQLL